MMKIFGGRFKGKALESPKGKDTRPTSGFLREAVFNICASSIEGALFLDLFAGSGAMGLEALSRGAAHTTFVESDHRARRVIQSNIHTLSLGNSSEIVPYDAVKALDHLIKVNRSFDMIYLDPPYYIRGQSAPSYSVVILENILEGELLKKGGHLFVEDSKECPIDQIEIKNREFVRQKDRKSGRSLLRHFMRES